VVWQRSASHGREPGKKRFEGDGKTPEGQYTVAAARTSQRFGLFMPISYPNAEDIQRARTEGREAGGGVGIHGPQRWYAFLGRAQALLDHSDGARQVYRRPATQRGRALAGRARTRCTLRPAVGSTEHAAAVVPPCRLLLLEQTARDATIDRA